MSRLGAPSVSNSRVWTAGAAFVFSLCFGSSASSEPLTFRGLGATSTQADVLRSFPSAQVENYCNTGETLARSAEGVTLCAQLRVDEITLDNSTFSGTFSFDPDGHLRYLSLMRILGAGFKGTANDIASARSITTSLADLLSTKYGPSVKDSPDAWMHLKEELVKLEWQPGRGDKWLSGGDRISLSAEANESARNPGNFVVTVQLFYRFARKQELNQL